MRQRRVKCTGKDFLRNEFAGQNSSNKRVEGSKLVRVKVIRLNVRSIVNTERLHHHRKVYE